MLYKALFLLGLSFNVYCFTEHVIPTWKKNLFSEGPVLQGWACLKCGQSNPDRYMSCGNCGTRQGSSS